METAKRIASYICHRYQTEYGSRIDEMKLHKLLYFVQRECMIQTGNPMFAELFKAWRYGPVMVEIRQSFRDDDLHEELSKEEILKYQKVFDKVFDTLAIKSSWSLSILSHGEYSWKKARIGYSKDAVCDVDILTEDIQKDADRIRVRRFLLDRYKQQRTGC